MKYIDVVSQYGRLWINIKIIFFLKDVILNDPA